MYQFRDDWHKYVLAPDEYPVPANDTYEISSPPAEMRFTDNEIQRILALRDYLIRQNVITGMKVHNDEARTTLVFVDERRKDNVFFHMQKICTHEIPEYRIGPGKISKFVDTLNFNVAMAALKEVGGERIQAAAPQLVQQ